MMADGGNDEAGFVDGIIQAALDQDASKIHFEFSGPLFIVQFRRSDRLAEITRLSSGRGADIIRQIQEMAQIDSGDTGQSQVGQINLDGDDHDAIIEVSVLQYRGKERVVMDIRRSVDLDWSLDMPGMTQSVHDILANALAVPDGIILVTGPAESGKTATIYALIEQLKERRRNICTVEKSPVHLLEDIVQTDVSQQNVPDFSIGLQAVLRQDPDVVMLGEVPDPATADLAVRAALDGRLILSAVPANNAVGAITRMRELKADPFLLASSLRAVLAQRQVRQLCAHCAEPIQADGSLASLLGFDRGEVVYRETGCERCGSTGFDGKIGIFEAIQIDETLRKLIAEGGDESRIASLAFLKQPNLASAARTLVKQGKITAEDGIQISRIRHAMVTG